jgi:hypothetical protein
MLLYWFLFLVPASWALSRRRPGRPIPHERFLFSLAWLVIVLTLSILIGLRHEVGGDWRHYLPYSEAALFLSLSETLRMSDPGYAALNWLGANLGGGIYTVNAVCGLLFSLGLVAFSNTLPRPSLAIAVAAPYLILVVAMGYSRQGVALGIAMLGLAYLQRGGTWKFVLAISIAGLFHKSAIILIMIALTSISKHKLLKVTAILSVSVALYLLLLSESINFLRMGYLEQRAESSGAGIRIAMNALPAAVFLWYLKKFEINQDQRRLWTVMSLVALALIGALALSPSSTAVDRVALYLIPLQLFVWSHFPEVCGRPGRRNCLGIIMILTLYAAVLFTWLNFAHHSYHWIPYKFYPLELLYSSQDNYLIAPPPT